MGVLDSRTVVITGGSLGIGLAIAKACAAAGASVIIAARDQTKLEKAMSDLRSISGGNHLAYPVNVASHEEVVAFSRWAAEKVGEIHGLVNSAGTYGPIGRFDRISIDRFKEAIEINFLGTATMCHAFIPLLKSKTRRKIVNLSGGGAASPFPNFSAYATSKIAVVRFTENLSLELSEDGIDVNCVAPGFVITRLHQETLLAGPERATQAFFESTKSQIEQGGVPPEKAADLTLFLLSSASDGITGRFISAPWDPWSDPKFQQRLREDRDFAALRRIDDKTFFKKG